MGFSNPVTSLAHVDSVGTVDSVTGSVGSVTDPVTAGAGSIDVVGQVTSSVPTPSRDLFYWPAIRGEGFPPSFSGLANYGSLNGAAVYSVPVSNTGSVTFPNIPRLPAGRSTLTLTIGVCLAASATPILHDVATLVGPGGASFTLSASNSTAVMTCQIGARTAVGSAADLQNVLTTITIIAHADGSGSMQVGSGAAVALPAGTMPANAGGALTSIGTSGTPAYGPDCYGPAEVVYS